MVIFTVTINFEQVKINSSITTIERLFFSPFWKINYKLFVNNNILNTSLSFKSSKLFTLNTNKLNSLNRNIPE